MHKLGTNRNKLIVLILLFISTLCCLALGAYLREYTGRSIYLYLNWDMFLAWVPVGFALILDWLVIGLNMKRGARLLSVIPILLLWLFFYPNSAYLVTDILHPFIHYKPEPGIPFLFEMEFWHHLLLFFTAAVIGLLLSFYTLYSVQELVKGLYGRTISWIFAVTVLLLASYGIYIGRFIRWNSWDVFTRPKVLLTDLFTMLLEREQLLHIISFTKLIFVCLMLSYCVLIAITHLRVNKY
ncbi:DUF1361 domain-containing protein [Paenibacillus mendelii]|uniref:DUF1361 domain-containing protein n=1 Tax=Paenibacillus mendelii TaxID=206163 RepID=A0ABV6J6L2_9BACL|nr:DUF1361 domain-containing protein [Paenibacillus mendelii]